MKAIGDKDSIIIDGQGMKIILRKGEVAFDDLNSFPVTFTNFIVIGGGANEFGSYWEIEGKTHRFIGVEKNSGKTLFWNEKKQCIFIINK